MATAGHLTSVAVSFNDSDYYTIKGVDSFSTSLGRDLLEYTEFGDTHHKVFAGLKDGSGSISGYFDNASAAYYFYLAVALEADLWIQVKWDGSAGFNVKCLVSRLGVSQAADDKVNFSADVEFIAAHDTTMEAIAGTTAASGVYAGHTGSVKLTGTATTMTLEDCTDLGGDVWQITDATKQIIDPNTSVTITDDDGAVAAAEYSIDYLTGKVTFSVTPVTTVANIRVTGKYLPAWTISTARESSLDITADLDDITVFGDTAHNRKPTLRSATVTLSAFDDALTDYDTGGTTLTLDDVFANGTLKVVEINLGNSGSFFRMFCYASQSDVDSAPDTTVSGSFSWTSTMLTTADSTRILSYSFTFSS